eukprot:842631-Prymnesium_polylepis.1
MYRTSIQLYSYSHVVTEPYIGIQRYTQDTARYSDTAIHRDTAIQMYHHPSDAYAAGFGIRRTRGHEPDTWGPQPPVLSLPPPHHPPGVGACLFTETFQRGPRGGTDYSDDALGRATCDAVSAVAGTAP